MRIVSAVLLVASVVSGFFSAYTHGLIEGRGECIDAVREARLALMRCNRPACPGADGPVIFPGSDGHIVFDDEDDTGAYDIFGDTVELYERGRVVKRWVDGVLVYDESRGGETIRFEDGDSYIRSPIDGAMKLSTETITDLQ